MKLFLNWDAARLPLKAALDPDWQILDCREHASEAELAQALAEADAAVSNRWPASWPEAPRLKLLQTTGAGYDQVDLAALPPACALSNVFEHEAAMAEFIILAMLEWQIGLRRLDAGLRKGEWLGWSQPHARLLGRSVGFVGYGHIARETARRLRPFGAKVLARTRSPLKGGEFADEIAGMDQLDSMLRQSDFVVLTCPLDASTRGLIGPKELALMKPTAVLINVARGPVADEDALYEACLKRRIAGAVIDAWYQYPHGPAPCFPSKHPFHDLDNVILSPHASAEADDLLLRRCQVIAENLNRLARGEALLNPVRPGKAA